MATVTDYAIVCGLSGDGHPVNGQETDWYNFGIPVRNGDVWEFQFQCMHKAGAPNATVVGSFVMYNLKGVYQGITQGPIVDLTDSTSWQTYRFQYQFTADLYVFPCIWWHGVSPLVARYICGVMIAHLPFTGNVALLAPDVFLTLGAGPPDGSDPNKILAGTKSKIGPT